MLKVAPYRRSAGEGAGFRRAGLNFETVSFCGGTCFSFYVGFSRFSGSWRLLLALSVAVHVLYSGAVLTLIVLLCMGWSRILLVLFGQEAHSHVPWRQKLNEASDRLGTEFYRDVSALWGICVLYWLHTSTQSDASFGTTKPSLCKTLIKSVCLSVCPSI